MQTLKLPQLVGKQEPSSQRNEELMHTVRSLLTVTKNANCKTKWMVAIVDVRTLITERFVITHSTIGHLMLRMRMVLVRRYSTTGGH